MARPASTHVLRQPGSLWQAFAPPQIICPHLSGEEETELAIVGGGMAGISLAYHLAAEHGLAPMVLEAEDIGAGAVGASGGIVAPQLVRTTPDVVLQRYGMPLGEAYLRMLAESGHVVFGLVRQHGLNCDAYHHGFMAPARDSEAKARLGSIIEQWKPFRRDLQLLDAAQVASLSGCAGYTAGLLDGSGGGLNPLAYTRELARVAQQAGARIYTQSRVTEVTATGTGWLLKTAQGSVKARQVILCGNGGNAALHPNLRQTTLPLDVYEVATEPLSDAQRQRILPGLHTMTDLETDVFTVRYAHDGRLITAYPKTTEQSFDAVEAVVNQRLKQNLLEFEPVRLAFVWSGTAQINPSLMPRLVTVADGLIAVQACNGRGIALNTVIGRELARWLAAPTTYALPVPLEQPQKITGFGIARHVPRLLMAASLMKRRLQAYGQRIFSGNGG